jgi:hypothetical protein
MVAHSNHPMAHDKRFKASPRTGRPLTFRSALFVWGCTIGRFSTVDHHTIVAFPDRVAWDSKCLIPTREYP